MNRQIDKILTFTLSGTFAHFIKFYTNSSSLSYLIPPRTVIEGMLGSILMKPRDSYYQLFDPSDCLLSVAISQGSVIKKSVQSVNMLHEKYFSFLEKGSGNSANMHTQCKMELLMSSPRNPISYRIYAAFPSNPELGDALEQKLNSFHGGYGLYFGQRQFRAYLTNVDSFENSQIEYLEQSSFLDSIILEENVIHFSIEDSDGLYVVVERMPIHMKLAGEKGQNGREPISVKSVLFERNGKRLSGSFKYCYRVEDKFISFF